MKEDIIETLALLGYGYLAIASGFSMVVGIESIGLPENWRMVQENGSEKIDAIVAMGQPSLNQTVLRSGGSLDTK